MLVSIANREGRDQTASEDLGLRCLTRPFWQVISFQNFRVFLVLVKLVKNIIYCGHILLWPITSIIYLSLTCDSGTKQIYILHSHTSSI